MAVTGPHHLLLSHMALPSQGPVPGIGGQRRWIVAGKRDHMRSATLLVSARGLCTLLPRHYAYLPTSRDTRPCEVNYNANQSHLRRESGNDGSAHRRWKQALRRRPPVPLDRTSTHSTLQLMDYRHCDYTHTTTDQTQQCIRDRHLALQPATHTIGCRPAPPPRSTLRTYPRHSRSQ